MAMWYTIVAFVSVIALSSAVPRCLNLGEYAMNQEVKDDLVPKVILKSGRHDIASISEVYDCDLEEQAGKVLEGSYKYIKHFETIGIHALPFSIKEGHGSNLRLLTHAALDTWKDHIRTTPFFTFGCNYKVEDDTHHYLCLLRHEAE